MNSRNFVLYKICYKSVLREPANRTLNFGGFVYHPCERTAASMDGQVEVIRDQEPYEIQRNHRGKRGVYIIAKMGLEILIFNGV